MRFDAAPSHRLWWSSRPPRVQAATVAPITVDGTGKLKIFIGIQEDGAAGFTLREAPQGEQRLPDELALIYRDFMKALGPAVRKGGDREDHSQGHAPNQHRAGNLPRRAPLRDVDGPEQGLVSARWNDEVQRHRAPPYLARSGVARTNRDGALEIRRACVSFRARSRANWRLG
jgi:hypothetical protein